MQKIEDEPAIEWHNMLRAADGLREHEVSAERLAAWQSGHTGFPLVDACMRSLRATGWLTFRMRAMLVSFASYSLWLHWRPTGLHLARHFLDFEPGIHWSQMQMQSGTTGINTVRIYNPVKQSHDHDPAGRFIRRWIPELERVPDAAIHTPWTLDRAEQAAAGIIGADEAGFRAGQERSATGYSRTPATRTAMVEWSMRSDRQAMASAIREVMTTDLRPGLAAMTTPVWAVYAADADGGAPAAMADALWAREYAGLPGVRLIRVDASRHFIMADQPARFAELVDQLLAETF
jgi:pimeloyl-ACP methyl ester carboxylesterase